MRQKKRFQTIRRLGRKFLAYVYRLFGEELELLTLESALHRCKTHTQIGTVIDIGASDGRWTRVCRHYYPGAFYFLIEAQQPHQAALERLKAETRNLDFLIAAAGDREGEIYFDSTDLLGGAASYTAFEKNNIVVPMVTIDQQVEKMGLKPPYLIKLDTHGFEVSILKGAEKTLGNTSLVVIETYNFNFSNENIRFHEMVAHMETLGFRCVDISDPLHRPGDHALFQMDLFFVPANHPLFKQKNFS